MSLLLDARKKSQQTHNSVNTGGLELSLEEFPSASSVDAETQSVEQARTAGQNLFAAKAHTPLHARAGINRNLLIALGGTILLVALGAGYVWYAISPDAPQPLRRPPTPTQPLTQSAPAAIEPQSLITAVEETAAPPKISTHAPNRLTSTRKKTKSTLNIQTHPVESIDPILKDAYNAYLGGKFDQAQQLYLKALKLDGRNTDALLGLAAVAQRRSADSISAHYYAQVLELDPRNAVANAGMSALTTVENSESRLKILLNGQPDSSSLHFALGNLYARQSRWAEAQQSYFNAYKLSPSNTELAFNLAVSLDRLGQKQVASQYYQRALELDQKSNAGFIDHAKISQRIKELTD